MAFSRTDIFVEPPLLLDPNSSVPISYMSDVNSTESPLPQEQFYMPESLKSFMNIINYVAIPIVCSLGIVGDVTSFVVFTVTSFRYQPCSQYLAALSFVDTMFLITQLMNSLIVFFPSLKMAPGYCNVTVYISYVSSFLSAWFIVLMMIERYIVVCHPFRMSIICTRSRSVNIIFITAAVSVLLYSHSLFTTSQGCIVHSDYHAFMIVFTYIDAVVSFLIPFIIILFLNLKIIFTVRKFRHRHNMINRSLYGSRRYYNTDKTLSLAQVRATKMLVRVSTVFVILYLPSYGVRVYFVILKQLLTGGKMSVTSKTILTIAQQICHFLYILNFAIDFIVYVVTSNNFRRNMNRCLRKIYNCNSRTNTILITMPDRLPLCAICGKAKHWANRCPQRLSATKPQQSALPVQPPATSSSATVPSPKASTPPPLQQQHTIEHPLL